MAVSADRFTQRVLVRAVAGGRQHARLHRDGPHLDGLVAQGPQPHRREPDLARAPRRRAAALRGGSRRTTRATRGRCGAPTASASTTCPTRAARENIWTVPSPAARPRQLTTLPRRPRRLADHRVRRQDDRLRARLRRLDARRRHRQGAPKCRSRCAARAATPVVEHTTLTHRLPVARAVARRKKVAFVAHGDVFAASARDGGEADAHHDDARARDAARVGAGQPPARLRLEPRRTDAPVRLRFRHAHRDASSPTAPLNDVDPVWSPDGKSIAFDRGAQGAARRSTSRRSRIGCSPRGQLRPAAVPHRSRRSPGRPTASGSPTSASASRAIPESICRAGRTAAARKPVAFLSERLRQHASRGARTGRICCSIRRSAPSKAVIARVDLVPRTPRFREDQFRDLFAPSRARHAGRSRRRARRRRSATARRCALTRLAARRRSATQIVFDDIRRRITLPAGRRRRAQRRHQPGRQDGAAQRRAPPARRTSTPSRSTSSRRGPAVARQLTSTPGFKQSAQFSPDGKEVYYLENGRINAIERRLARRRARSPSRAELDVDFAREKIAVFHAGVEHSRRQLLRAAHERRGLAGRRAREYEPYVAGAQSTEDLRRIMRLMVGELNASHSGVNGPSFSPQPNVGRLGVRFDRARVRAARQAARDRGAHAEPGRARRHRRPGDYIQSVDGVRVDGTHQSRLAADVQDQSARRRLASSRGDDGSGARTIAHAAGQPRDRARPACTAIGSRAAARTSRRRAAESSATSTCTTWAPARSQQLYVDLDTENRAQGRRRRRHPEQQRRLRESVRDRRLRAPRLPQFTPRDFGTGGGRSVVGQRSLERPTVLVTNMHSLSDAEDFTEGYRALKLGPVVGEPTAGWIIFTSDFGLLDGSSSVRVPFERITDAAGKDMEMHPRPVDVLVQRARRRELHRARLATRRRREELLPRPPGSRSMSAVIRRVAGVCSRCAILAVALVTAPARRAAPARPRRPPSKRYFELVRPAILRRDTRTIRSRSWISTSARRATPASTPASSASREFSRPPATSRRKRRRPARPLTYRIERRPMTRTGVGAGRRERHDRRRVVAAAATRDQPQHAGDQLVLDAGHRRRRRRWSTSARGRPPTSPRQSVAGKIVLADGSRRRRLRPRPSLKRGAHRRARLPHARVHAARGPSQLDPVLVDRLRHDAPCVGRSRSRATRVDRLRAALAKGPARWCASALP